MKMGEQLTECMRKMSTQNCEFKAALNILIKYEIQCLLKRLSDTGEEAIIITTSVSDTYHGYYGSVKGMGFLHSTQKKLSIVKEEFLKYCADDSRVPASVHQTLSPRAKRMNSLTFMSSIRARSGGPTTVEIQASHISTKLKYLSTDKTERFLTEEICQGQTAVEPKYCHAQVACLVMMVNKDQSIVEDDCRNELQEEVNHIEQSPSRTVNRETKSTDRETKSTDRETKSKDRETKSTDRELPGDISPWHSKGEQYSFQSDAGSDWLGKDHVTNHMFCFSGKHPVTSSSNNQDLGHNMLVNCKASTMDDPIDFTWKIEKHEHFSGDSNKKVSNFQHAKSVIKQARDQNNVYSRSTSLNTKSSVCTYQDTKLPVSSAASSQLLRDDSGESGVDFSSRTIELENERVNAGRNRNVVVTECISSEMDCETKAEHLCEDCEDCKNNGGITNICHDKYKTHVYLGKDLSQHCQETKSKSIQADSKKTVTIDECKNSGVLQQFLTSTEDWDNQLIFKKNTLWDRKMQTDGHMFGAQLDISLSSNDDYENDVNPHDLVLVKKEPVQFEEYNVVSPMKNDLEVTFFPDRMSSEPLHSPIQLKFSCKICGERFKNRQFRDLHVKRHWSSHKFNCNFCSKGFDVESDFESHQNEHKGPVFLCDLCGYRCSREFRMKSHKEICGKPSQIFSCPYCNKPFAAKRYMRIHMKSHDSRNVNVCPFCQITYPLKNSLLKHIKKKHGSQLKNC